MVQSESIKVLLVIDKDYIINRMWTNTWSALSLLNQAEPIQGIRKPP